jgi:ankyrin repeat protein
MGENKREAIRQAISTGDISEVEKLLLHVNKQNDASFVTERVKQAASLGYDDIASMILDSPYSDKYGTLRVLLEYGRTRLVSEFLLTHRLWGNPTKKASNTSGSYDYSGLEDLLFRARVLSPIADFLPRLGVGVNDDQQFAFRLLAYHAMHTKDQDMLEWLLDLGLETDEVSLIDMGLRLVPKRDGAVNVLDESEMSRWPSLLSIAAVSDNTDLAHFLIEHGVESMDSRALYRAIRGKVSTAMLNVLMDFSDRPPCPKRSEYGSAALRDTIRSQDYALVEILAKRTDTNCIVSNPPPDRKEWYDGEPRSPLGESITTGDVEMVRILLTNEADPNALASIYDNMEVDDLEGDALEVMPLQRRNPLLMAIDCEDLSMIQLLIESGAEVDSPRRLGLLRTPLQRAAETGKFEIVKFLLHQGAIVDQGPFYNGATALQLAAIGGYVGIAKLLLEHGADPNHPAAKGDGRTALEGAAEWGRLDMVMLLVEAGVNLDQASPGYDSDPYFGEVRYKTWNGLSENSTQCTRAIHLAKLRGHLAKLRGHLALSRILQEMDRCQAQERPRKTGSLGYKPDTALLDNGYRSGMTTSDDGPTTDDIGAPGLTIDIPTWDVMDISGFITGCDFDVDMNHL